MPPTQTPPAPAATTDADSPRGSIFKDWILPIVIGLAIGGGIVLLWQKRDALFGSDAWRIARRWEEGAWEENEQVVKDLTALGKESRADVLRAFRRAEVPDNPWGGEDRWKTWLGEIVAREPFLDARSLLEIARDPAAPKWDRRAAAAALVRVQRKDVDPTAVLEPLLEWLEDLTLFDHDVPFDALRILRSSDLFPPDQEGRYRAALLRLAAPDARSATEEDDKNRLGNDRDSAVQELNAFIRDADVLAAVWKIAEDETDEDRVRSQAVQALARAQQFGDVEAWKRLAASKDRVVRQTVADTLEAAPGLEFDAVLAPLHEDAAEFTRSGSITTQVARRRPTMLPILGMLVEDHNSYVRRTALIASGRFKDEPEGLAARQGMALRILETSDDDMDLEGAVVSLFLLTDRSYGFEASAIDAKRGAESVLETALAAFKKDAEGRRIAVQKWREQLGPQAVWDGASRRAALERLAKHADPLNVERAQAELAKLDDEKK